MGKRFEDRGSGMQVLILKGNPGEEWQLMAGGQAMEQVGAKPLPSSD